MTTFEIHKGVDAPVEFKGLRSQYLFICARGLIGAFLIVVVSVSYTHLYVAPNRTSYWV